VSSGTNSSFWSRCCLPGLYQWSSAEPASRRNSSTCANFRHGNSNAECASRDRRSVERVTVERQPSSANGIDTLGRVTEGERVRALPLVTRNSRKSLPHPGVAAEVTDAGALGPGFSGPPGPGLVSNAERSWTIIPDERRGNNDCKAAGNSLVALQFQIQTPSRSLRSDSHTTLHSDETPGANVDVITKSGKGLFMVPLWEFFRNDVLNANSFFRNKTSQPRPSSKRISLGLTWAGPSRKTNCFFHVVSGHASTEWNRWQLREPDQCSVNYRQPLAGSSRRALRGQRGTNQTLVGASVPRSRQMVPTSNPVALRCCK